MVPEPPELEMSACPLCGCEHSNSAIQVVDNVCGIPGDYRVCRCQECRHLFLNPRPTPATLHRCYPEGYGPHQAPPPAVPSEVAVSSSSVTTETPWYLRYLPLRHVPGLRRLYYWLTNDLSQPLPQFPQPSYSNTRPRALELGCSTGGYLSALQNAGWDVVGVEPSEVASQKARDAGFDVHTGILDDAPLQDGTFDCVAGWMVVEHVIEPVPTLQNMFRLLKPGGQLLISIPNVGCWEPIVFRTGWYLWEAPRHLNHFTPRRIRCILQAAGYVNIRVIHQRNVLNLIGSCGIWLKRFSLTRRLGARVLAYPDSPRLAIQLLLSPLAHVLSLLRQGGRLTVQAERPPASDTDSDSAAKG